MTRHARLGILGFCLVAIACLYGAGSAAAEQFKPHVASGTFEATPNPGTEVRDVAVDDHTGSVYTLAVYEGALRIFKYDAEGNPSSFTDPSLGGSNELTVWNGGIGNPKIAVDNSNGPTQGRLYVMNAAYQAPRTFAFESSGAAVGGKFPIEVAGELLAVDPTTGDFWESSVSLVGHLTKYLPDGSPTSTDITNFEGSGEQYSFDIGAEGDIYTFSYPYVTKLDPTNGKTLAKSARIEVFGGLATNQVNGNVIFDSYRGFEFNPELTELPGFEFEANYSTSVAVDGTNEYLYINNGNNTVHLFKPGPAVTLPEISVGAPSNIEPTQMTLHATVNPAGVETSKCTFEYGATVAYGESAPCSIQNITGSSPVAVSATISGLTQGGVYHYRIVVENKETAPNNKVVGTDHTARPSAPPQASTPYVDQVHVDSGVFHDEITPEGAPTTYHVLYGTADCETEPGACLSTPESSSIGVFLKPVPVEILITGLTAATTYHYLFVATNQSGTFASPQKSFTTFPYNPAEFEDSCPNAHVRQQTGAALLPDCRAYELASASNQNGYDVESYLVGGQVPFSGYPEASGKVLYGIHDGALPGTGNPTNHGLDPYIATRGENGWTTKYVGIPATDPYSTLAFGSPLLAADSSLNTFAFGGEGLCSPCFGDGSTGIPVTLPDGSLVQGMTGPADPGPSAQPNLLAKKPLSANGVHLLFGSNSEFENGASSSAIYDRNLQTGVTHAISKLPGGGAIPCLIECSTDGLAELDVSADGSHVVIGQLISVDSAGNHYWHLYMNVDDSSTSIDLTPGTTEGALYDGMTSSGSMVYFTTADQLTSEDSDDSPDIYRATLNGASASLKLVSVGGGNGNSDNCEPTSNSVDEFWNSAEGEENCGVVAVSGGGGVATSQGGIYFLSPELLDGTSEPEDGVENAPNLYVGNPGSAPEYVTTLESSLTGPNPPVTEHRHVGSFAKTQNPKWVAVDNSGGPSDGDVYVADPAEEKVRKYTSEGTLITSWGTNGVLNHSFPKEITAIGVGPEGHLFVGIWEEFNSGNDLFEFDENGALVAEHNPEYTFLPGTGMTIDGHGDVFFRGYYEKIIRWDPTSGESTYITTWEYESGPKTGVAADPVTNELYVSYGGAKIGRFRFDNQGRVIESSGSPCVHDCEPTEFFAENEISGIRGMAVDPTTEELYADVGNNLVRFNRNGTVAAGPSVGGEVLTNSNGVAVSNAGDIYATSAGSSGASVEHFGPPVLAADPRTDSPIVVHGVNDSGTRYTGDFQVNPSGRDAVFPTTIPYTGFDNNGFEALFLYNAANGGIECISCNPTNAKAVGNALLARQGLSLLEDGRVFFDSDEPLVPRDLDHREDVYEWENGKANLITTGISAFDSDLLTASSDGKDVFFFTRDQLAPQDTNGKLVKIYDAREGGGFPYTPPENTCKASDECHGPASQPGPSPGINTITGTGGNEVQKPKATTCKKGYVKKHGKCVKKTKPKKHKKSKKGKKAKRVNGKNGGGAR